MFHNVIDTLINLLQRSEKHIKMQFITFRAFKISFFICKTNLYYNNV